MRFRVQFGINLHEWVFQLFEKLASANLFQIEREKSYDYLLIIQTWKNSRGKSAGRCFLKPFFAFENFFQSFRTKFLSLLYLISSTYKISHFLSDNHKPELRCVICTGITLSAPVLHLNCTALGQSESSIFFHVYDWNFYYHFRVTPSRRCFTFKCEWQWTGMPDGLVFCPCSFNLENSLK